MESPDVGTRSFRATKWGRKYEQQRQYLERYGFRIWLIRFLCWLARGLVGFRALRGMTLDPGDMDPKYLREVPPFSHLRTTAPEFVRLDGAAEVESERFYRDAAARGDWSHAMMDGGAIASYGWYATDPVPAIDDVWISYSSEYVYMYKGFTLPNYRGRQLHAHGMARAAVEAVEEGYRGLISFVEVQNEGSLRSVARLGYRTFGTCYRFRIPGKTLTFSSPGCAPYGFRLVVAEDLPEDRRRRASGARPSRAAEPGSTKPGISG